jgi:hypothetical protein
MLFILQWSSTLHLLGATIFRQISISHFLVTLVFLIAESHCYGWNITVVAQTYDSLLWWVSRCVYCSILRSRDNVIRNCDRLWLGTAVDSVVSNTSRLGIWGSGSDFTLIYWLRSLMTHWVISTTNAVLLLKSTTTEIGASHRGAIGGLDLRLRITARLNPTYEIGFTTTIFGHTSGLLLLCLGWHCIIGSLAATRLWSWRCLLIRF